MDLIYLMAMSALKAIIAVVLFFLADLILVMIYVKLVA